MLEASWEKYATQLANADSDDALVQVYNELVKTLKINLDAPARVIFARDTRASGSRLVECLNNALNATSAEFTDYKILRNTAMSARRATTRSWLLPSSRPLSTPRHRDT